jgi:hypothetical protein
MEKGIVKSRGLAFALSVSGGSRFENFNWKSRVNSPTNHRHQPQTDRGLPDSFFDGHVEE